MDDSQFDLLTVQITGLSGQVSLFGNDIERHDRQLKALEKRADAADAKMDERLGAIEDLASAQENLQRMNNGLLTGFIEKHDTFLSGMHKERDDKAVVSAAVSRFFSTGRRAGLTTTAIVAGLGSAYAFVGWALQHIK